MDIVRFRPEDRGELQRFLDAGVLDDGRARPDFWDWVFHSNPDATAGSEIWLLKDGGRIVGQLPTYRTAIRIADRILPARVTFDFALLPEYRNRAAGPLMVRALGGDDGVLLNLGPNRAAFPIFNRMGWKMASVLPRAMAVLDPGAALLRFGLPAGAARVVGAVGRPLCNLLAEPVRGGAGGRIGICRRFGPEFDRFWADWSSRFPIAIARNHRRMNWRFADFPLHGYDVFTHHVGDALAGYLVARVTDHKGVPTGLIVEHAGAAASAELLLRYSLRHFAERGVGVVHTRLPHPDWVGLYQRAGFFVRQSASHIVRLMFRPAPDIDSALLQVPRNWFVTAGDGDADW